jgi:hypothetical protein
VVHSVFLYPVEGCLDVKVHGVFFYPVDGALLASDCIQLIDPTAEGFRRAETYLRRALELDPTSVEATWSLGICGSPGGADALRGRAEQRRGLA